MFNLVNYGLTLHLIDECLYQQYSADRGVHCCVPSVSYGAALFPREEGNPLILSQQQLATSRAQGDFLRGQNMRLKTHQLHPFSV